MLLSPGLPLLTMTSNHSPWMISRINGRYGFSASLIARIFARLHWGTLSAAVDQLQSEKGIDDLYIIFVSVDPDRDFPEQLKTYVSAFSQKVIGVTSEQPNLDAFMKNMGVVAVKQPDENSPR